MQKITILIVEDHQLIRQFLSFTLNDQPEFQVKAEAGSAEEAIDIVKRIRPDVIILDINLPGMNGVEATLHLRKYAPGSKILGVSMHTQPNYVRQMIRNGAMGYVAKVSSKEELFHAIKEIHAGRKYICNEIKDIFAKQLITEEKNIGINDLSRRELEIIHYLRKGLSSKEIAQALFISVKTVEVHRHNILKKLNLKNTPSLINFINQNYWGDRWSESGA